MPKDDPELDPSENPLQIQELGRRLRSLRISQKLTLSDVERLSNGAIKAVVLGSYERATRSLSVRRAIEIAEIYQIPLAELLDPSSRHINTENHNTPERIIVDIRKLTQLIHSSEFSEDENLRSLYRFLRRIIAERQDWNGEIISIRKLDLEILATTIDLRQEAWMNELDQYGLLLRKRALGI
jgi:transcriptional regulator with XRE-family HTH domain